jgi:erythromycin esterase
MYTWPRQTEEVLALVEWMRAFNAAPGAHATLSVRGFDMQHHEVALEQLLAAVRGTPEATRVQTALSRLVGLEREPWRDPALRPLADSAETILALLTERKAPERTRRLAYVIARSLRNRVADDRDFRDGVMAENVRRLLDTDHPREKIVLWAHNAHVSTEHTPQFPGGRGTRHMGNLLRESLGADMYVLGITVDSGTVRARRPMNGTLSPPIEARLPPAAAGSGTAMLRQIRVPQFFLDLRATRGSLRAWLEVEHGFQEIGAGFAGAAPPLRTMALLRNFDGLVFLQGPTASRMF